MKKTATLLILFAAVALFAEVPNGYNEALALYSQGKYEESLAKVRSVFEENKTSYHLRMLAAANHAHAGRFNDAAAHLQYLLKDHPDRPEPAALYAAILRKQGQTGDAQGLIARAMQQDPKNMNFVLEAARIHYRAGNFAAARKHIENVLLTVPGNQEALALDGLIFLRQGNPENAVFRFRQALGQPSSSKAALSDLYNNMAIALRRSADALEKNGNPGEAASMRTEASDMLARSLEQNPSNAIAKANKEAK
ncbi:MAG TPA: tetratricopeptide repeat protein [Leptospiraceae bacterium]|nr:tetratricopeptide repeat protein [Leptospiraceae bacterium]HMZ37533.1 tetratricopeptide repeat protein [Leptospiraceae bacterium]HNL02584.1 tetratricopeptide repeat protein [Leptospiraceae bacterium]